MSENINIVYILKERDTSRDAIEGRRKGIKISSVNVGVALEKDVAEKWEESKDERKFEKTPVVDAVEKTAYDFRPREMVEKNS